MMKKNDTTIVKIEDIGVSGEGIGKVEGYTLFVKDAVIGDTVEAVIKKKKKTAILNHIQCESHRDKLIFALLKNK